MSRIPGITESELEVMKLLWENNPLSANEIIYSLADKMNWSSQTIKTFLNRLLNKEVIGFEKNGRNYQYYPLVSQDEYLKAENKSFLHQFYNGTVSMLFSKFLEEEEISEEEIDKIQEILEKKKKGK
jgi:BlaI family penicillinase repressor